MIKTTIQKVESQLLVPASITDLVEAVRTLPGKEQRKIVEACGNVEPQETAPTEQVRADICDLQHDRDAAYSKLTKLHAKLISAEARVRQLEEEREQFHDQSLMPEHVSVLLATLNKRSDAARLWKRAAKAYRREARDAHTWSEADRLREECRRLQGELSAANHDRVKAWEERDAAHAALRTIAEHVGGRVSPECSHEFHLLVANEVRGVCDGQRCIVARLTKERDDALANRDGAIEALGDKIQQLEEVRAELEAATALHADISDQISAAWAACPVAGSVRGLTTLADVIAVNERDRQEARAELARMRPVVEAACIAYDAGSLPGYSTPGIHGLRRAVEAYRAGGEKPADVGPHDVTMTCPHCGPAPHRYGPSPDAGPYWRCSECGEPATTSAVCHATSVQDCDHCEDTECGDNTSARKASLPDVQRNYRAPDNDTAERIADDAASESSRPATGVVRRRIEALVDSGIRGAMLRIAIACDIHEASGHVVDDIVEAIERLKRDRSLLAATTGEARKLEADAFAYRKHFRAVASAIGAHITEDEWEEMTPNTAERVAAEVDAAQPEPAEPTPDGVPTMVWCLDPFGSESGMVRSHYGSWATGGLGVKYIRADIAASQVRAALEAAAERAVALVVAAQMSDGEVELVLRGDLRRAVMGDEE